MIAMSPIRKGVSFLGSLCLAPFVLAQAPGAAAATARPEFEVASIKPNASGEPGMRMQMLLGGRLHAENIILRTLILVAYDLRDFQISGGPAWISSDRYDLNAKTEGNPTFEQLRPMLQSLLADRFKLAFHREKKEASIYDLTAAKGGLKIAPSKEGSCTIPDQKNPPPPPSPGEKPPIYCDNLRIGKGRIDAYGILMPRLLNVISDLLGRPIIDKTGFSARFDVHLEFAPDEATVNGPFGQGGGVPSTDSTTPSIFTALQEQLGGKLESGKGPIEVLVIDHVERPSEN
jgi:uncharacterized protein (TIGR03435 family)